MRFRFSAPPTNNRTPLFRLRALVAALFCSGSGLFALRIAITGSRVSGGFWFLPDATNQMVGRVVFGVCGVLCLAIAWMAFRDVRAPGT